MNNALLSSPEALIQSLREIHQIASEVSRGLSPPTIARCHHMRVSHSSPQIMTYTEREPSFPNTLKTILEPESPHLHSKQ